MANEPSTGIVHRWMHNGHQSAHQDANNLRSAVYCSTNIERQSLRSVLPSRFPVRKHTAQPQCTEACAVHKCRCYVADFAANKLRLSEGVRQERPVAFVAAHWCLTSDWVWEQSGGFRIWECVRDIDDWLESLVDCDAGNGEAVVVTPVVVVVHTIGVRLVNSGS